MLLGITQLTSEKTDIYTGISGMAPGQVSAPFVCLPMLNKYLFSAWHFLCFCGLFSVLTSYSLTS